MAWLDWLIGPRRTPAETVAHAQKRHPPKPMPGTGPDYGKHLYTLLEPRLPANVRELFHTGTAAIGELGKLVPDAYAEFVPPAGYAILFYTGMTRFLYRVSRALHSRVRAFGPEGAVEELTTEFDKTVAIVAEVFRNYMAEKKIAGPHDYQVSPEQKGIASALATHAETFFLAHEIAHVVIGCQERSKSTKLSPQQEIDADRLALTFVLGLNGEPNAMKGISPRMVYAGAEFALRVFAGLGHLGHKFKETHPPPGTRLISIRELAKQLYGGRRGFIKLSTIAFAYDQLLEAVEGDLAGPRAAERFVVGVTPERVLSTLSVLIERCVKGQIAKKFVIEEVTKLCAEAPELTLGKAAEEALVMYREGLAEPLATSDQILFAQQELDMFFELIKALPQPCRRIFEDASRLSSGGGGQNSP